MPDTRLTDRLEQQIAPHSRTALTQLYLPSYEVRGSVWTDNFLDRFLFLPDLPAVLGKRTKTQILWWLLIHWRLLTKQMQTSGCGVIEFPNRRGGNTLMNHDFNSVLRGASYVHC